MNFEPLNNFFDKIFVITLERSVDRQIHIKETLQGLRYEFFFGADKNNFSVEELKQKNIYNETLAVHYHRYGKPMNAGQICCALSHTKVYEEIINKNYKRTLILEDDVEPLEELKIFSEIVNELPAGWELLYLDYSKNEKQKPLKKFWYHLQKITGGLKWDHTIINNLYPKKVSEHIAIAGFHDYTDAYAVSPGGAKKLLALQTPVSYVADNLLATASSSRKIKAFISIPKLFNQLSQTETSQFDSLL
jgi:glycosyl transferase family 25